MAVGTTSTLGTRAPSSEGLGVGFGVGNGVRSGSILALLDQVDSDSTEGSDGTYVFHRLLTAAKEPAQREEWGPENDKAANYAIVAADFGKIVRLTGKTARTFTLPDIDAADSGIEVGDSVRVVNDSIKVLTVDGHGNDTVDGSANLALAAGKSRRFEVTGDATWVSREIFTEVLEKAAADTALKMFKHVELQFQSFGDHATYTRQGLADLPEAVREAFEASLLTAARNKVGREIVNPNPGVSFAGEGFNLAHEIRVATEPDQVPFPRVTEPWLALARACALIGMSFGNEDDMLWGFSAAVHPHFLLALQTHRRPNGMDGSYAPVWPLMSQRYGFGLEHGDTVGIVGVFIPSTAHVVWKDRPAVEHGTVGNNLLTHKRTAVVSARYGLAVKTPVAFCRIVAGTDDLLPS